MSPLIYVAAGLYLLTRKTPDQQACDPKNPTYPYWVNPQTGITQVCFTAPITDPGAVVQGGPIDATRDTDPSFVAAAPDWAMAPDGVSQDCFFTMDQLVYYRNNFDAGLGTDSWADLYTGYVALSPNSRGYAWDETDWADYRQQRDAGQLDAAAAAKGIPRARVFETIVRAPEKSVLYAKGVRLERGVVVETIDEWATALGQTRALSAQVTWFDGFNAAVSSPTVKQIAQGIVKYGPAAAAAF